jgi:diaminohydroxyphosphoribosylaminopyrimidine deaminase/5-amino-6-(5-phosphoribosylamino)uracil reductase
MTDEQWMAAAVALGERARGTTAPNPNVGCLLVRDGDVVGEGCTQPGGRPHAEAVALAQAGARAHGATAYVTLEPCAHRSERGPACGPALADAGIGRLVAALQDPDPRTGGRGFALLREAGIVVDTGIGVEAATQSLAGFLSRLRLGRPHVTLKLAMSLDGRIALASGESRWITGEPAREDVHRERAKADMILVGSGTHHRDRPRLDVRIAGLENRSPAKAILTRGEAPPGWTRIAAPEEIARLHDVNDLLIEGGAGAAAAFLRADLVDRLLIYRAPILIGEGTAAVGELGLTSLGQAHGRWLPAASAMLGIDRREVYERVRRT